MAGKHRLEDKQIKAVGKAKVIAQTTKLDTKTKLPLSSRLRIPMWLQSNS